MHKKKSIVLCVLDGFGFSNISNGNAISNADTPFLDDFFANNPTIKINASSDFVGLPKGQMGNSEVGHLTIGTGRITKQSLPLISDDMESGLFFKNKVFLESVKNCVKNKSIFHICGMFSAGGVHSHMNHMLKTIRFLLKFSIKIYIHVFSDGRDSKNDIFKSDLKTLLSVIKDFPNVNIATISGRFFSMDRDKRWKRTDEAINAFFSKSKHSFKDPIKYVNENYSKNVFDEFIPPAFNININPVISTNDTFFMINFRQDRMIQISSSLTNSNYEFTPSQKIVKGVFFISIRPYADTVNAKIIYPFKKYNNVLGEWLSKKKYTQLRIAETEKYAHVTYFLDGNRDIVFEGEERILIPSPKNVKTYDLKPEMSAFLITDKIIGLIGKYDVIIVNYANADMVGHTGDYNATLKAILAIDKCLQKIYNKIMETKSLFFLTSDHGNAEKMIENGYFCKKHTSNLVPFSFCGGNFKFKNEYNINNIGKLSDVAPTILFAMDLSIPEEMTGNILLEENE